jgi:hypothetical protein
MHPKVVIYQDDLEADFYGTPLKATDILEAFEQVLLYMIKSLVFSFKSVTLIFILLYL